MENRNLLIFIIVAGSLLSSTVSYLMVNTLNSRIDQLEDTYNEKIDNMFDSVNNTLNNIQEYSTEFDELYSLISNTYESIIIIEENISDLQNKNEELESQLTQIISDLDNLKGLTNKKNFILIHSERQSGLNSETAETETFEVEGNLIKIDYDFEVKNWFADEGYYTYATLKLRSSTGGLVWYIFLEGNEHYPNREHYTGSNIINVNPGEYYLEIDCNTNNNVEFLTFNIWDYN